MEIETARRHIRKSVDRMRSSQHAPVFDEWAVLALSEKTGSVVAYHGPRVEAFRRSVAVDAAPLLALAAGRQFADGDIEFAADAAGTRYDAFMKIGATSYLVLNHTGKTMTDIRSDPKWLAAQAILFELSEKFRADPLVVERS